MGIAEALSLAVHAGNLSWSDNYCRPIDYVAAMSASSFLGSDIFRAKSRDYVAARRAIMLLARKVVRASKVKKLPVSEAMARAMSMAVIIELCLPHCRVCGGARVTICGDLKVECPVCIGHGVHRYSNSEREMLIGIKHGEWAKWESRYEIAMQIAMAHDVAPDKALARLGR